MRMLFTTIPSDGHYQPLVQLARAAKAAGHDVAFCCAPSLCSTFESAGLEALPGGLNRDGDGDAEFVALKQRAQLLQPGAAEMDRLAIVDVMYGVRARRMLPDLARQCDHWRPDLIVHESYEAAGAVVADLRGIPHANVETTPLYDSRPMASAIQEQNDRTRADAGLGPARDMLRRQLNLCFAPPTLLDPELFGGLVPLTFRPELNTGDGAVDVPSELERFVGQRVAYITFGTVANRWRTDALQRMRETIVGVRAAGFHVIATVGRDTDAAVLGPQPSDVYVARYIPQEQVLPRVELCVSHAGFNTVLAAIAARLPQVLIPMLADNVHNAHRCTALGIAQTISPDDVTWQRVASATEAIAADGEYAVRTRALADELARLPGPQAAVDVLTRLGSGLASPALH